MKPFKKRIQFFIIFIFIGLIVSYVKTHKNELYMLKEIKIKDIAILLKLTLLIYIAHAFNVLLILRKSGLKKINNFEWFRIFIISRFINFHIIQGRIIYLVYKLKKKYAFSYTSSLSSFTFLTWFYTLSTLVFSVILIILINYKFSIKNINIVTILSVCIFVIFTFPFIINKIFTNFKNEKIKWIKTKIDELISTSYKNLNDLPLLGLMIVFSFLQFVLYIVIVKISFQSINVPVSLEQVSIFTIILMTSKYYNIVPNNLGITELLCGHLSQAFNGKILSGLIVSSLIRIVDYLLISFLGIIFAKISLRSKKAKSLI